MQGPPQRLPRRSLDEFDLDSDAEDEEWGGPPPASSVQPAGDGRPCTGAGGQQRAEEIAVYNELASFLLPPTSASGPATGDLSGSGSAASDERERSMEVRFFEDVLRFQKERLQILRRYHGQLASPERAFALAAKIDALFSFENLMWAYDDVEEMAAAARAAASRQPRTTTQRPPPPPSSSSPSAASHTPGSGGGGRDSEDSDDSDGDKGKQRRPRRTAKQSVRRFDQLLQDIKNGRREERTRAQLRRDEHYDTLQARIGARLDASPQRTGVWSLRTCCAFAIFDHALDERSEYSGVLPTELNDYVNTVAFPRRFLRSRWHSVAARLAPRTYEAAGGGTPGAAGGGGGGGGGASAAMAAGLASLLGESADGDEEERGDAEEDINDDEERRVLHVIATFELVPEGITFTIEHSPPRGNSVEEIAITCFGEDFIECSPGHAKGAPLFSCNARHVAGLTQDKFSSKYMTTLTKSLQTPKGIRNTDLLYFILSIYESGSDYPSLMSGLVQALKQKLASFTAVVALLDQ